MEQAILLETPSGPLPGAPVIRPALPREVLRGPSGPPQWEVVEEANPTHRVKSSEPNPTAAVIPNQPSLNWELVQPVQPTVADGPDQPEADQPQIAAGPTWEPVLPGEEISTADVAREIEAQESARKEAAAEIELKRPLATFSGFRNLHRSKRWYPSTTTIVPMGVGPSGFIAGIGFSRSDCRTESGNCIREYTLSADSINNRVEGTDDSFMAISNSSHSAVVINSQTSDSTGPFAKRLALFDQMQTAFSVTRNLDTNPDPKLSAGGDLLLNGKEDTNLFNSTVRSKSTFPMVSTPIPLPAEPAPETISQARQFSDLNLSLGMLNGFSRPSDDVIQAKIQDIKRARCSNAPCIPERLKKERIQGSERNEPSPIGALVIAKTDQLNLITKSLGHKPINLSSIQHIHNVGLPSTPVISNSTQISDYVNSFPKRQAACPTCDLSKPVTSRPIFYLTMISIRF